MDDLVSVIDRIERLARRTFNQAAYDSTTQNDASEIIRLTVRLREATSRLQHKPDEADVERVARAIYDKQPFFMPYGQRDPSGAEYARRFGFDEAPATYQSDAREKARAAIAAMQEGK